MDPSKSAYFPSPRTFQNPTPPSKQEVKQTMQINEIGKTTIQNQNNDAKPTNSHVKKWTDQEKRLLSQLCKNLSNETIDWFVVSLNLPYRSADECKKKWHSSLSPSLKKGHWSEEEKAKLKYAIENKKPSEGWCDIAAQIPGRTVYQCHTQWYITLNKGQALPPSWTPEDDKKLVDAVNKIGLKNWAEVNKEFKGRNRADCSKRWSQMKRIKKQTGSQINNPIEFGPLLKQYSPHQMSNVTADASTLHNGDLPTNEIEKVTGFKRNVEDNSNNTPIPDPKRVFLDTGLNESEDDFFLLNHNKGVAEEVQDFFLEVFGEELNLLLPENNNANGNANQ